VKEQNPPVSTIQVSIEELRAQLSDIVGRVMNGGEAVVITRYNRQAAVLIGAAEYERLLDPTRRLTKRQWLAQARKLEAGRRQVREVDPQQLEELVDQAVQEVRASKRQSKA
jgi:prevent-host-death family protein